MEKHKGRKSFLTNKNNDTSCMNLQTRQQTRPSKENNTMDIDIKKYNLLVLLLNFEKYWSPYSLSDGGLYERETREEAKKVVSLFKEIYGEKNAEISPNGKLAPPDELWEQRQVIEILENWCKTDSFFPKQVGVIQDRGKSRMYIQVILFQLENKLCKEFQLPTPLSFCTTAGEDLYRRNVLKWVAQLPNEVIDNINDLYINKMSKSPSLVLLADIRRSQDLMTYGKNPNEYSERIVKFINETRNILKKNCGIYDRFTGDGFIAYFNEYMCEQQGYDYYDMMLKSCREIMSFAEPFFAEWTSTLRKVPETEIGLAIGVDDGIVTYKDVNNQLFAIGDACVWATRMNSAGSQGDVILNNIPYQCLRNFLNEDNCKVINSITKSGEKFKAYCINIKNVNYVPTTKSQEHRESGAIS